MPSEIEEALEEVLPFLKWHSPFDYKTQVLEHLLGMTGTNDGCSQLSRHLELNKRLVELVILDRSSDARGGLILNICNFFLEKLLIVKP